MVDSETLVSVAKISNGVLQTDKTTWANTDTRLDHSGFFKENADQQISPNELGGGVVILKTRFDIWKWRQMAP